MKDKPILFLAVLLWLGGCLGAFFLGKKSSSPSATRLETTPSRSTAERTPSLPSSPSSPFLQKLQTLESSQDFETTFQKLTPELQNPQTHDQLFLLADQWSALHPEEAVRWINHLHFDDVRNPFLFSALSQWVRQNPEAALSWLDQHHPDDNPTRDYLLAAIVRGLAQTKPDQALGLLLKAPPSPERSGSLDFLLNTWSQESLTKAFAQIEQLPAFEDELRLRALKRVLSDLLPTEIPQAKTLAENLTNPREKQEALATLASKWAQHDIGEALKWTSQIEQPSARAKALGTLATQWARQDPEAASQWLADKQAPPFDLALRSAAGTLIATDPTTALSQITNISNPSLRAQSFEQIGRIWLSRDPQGFRATMENETPMPPEIRETLLQNFR